jgi:hypothetical protein
LLTLCKELFLSFYFFFVFLFESFDFLIQAFYLLSKLNILSGDGPALFNTGRFWLATPGDQHHSKTYG